MKTILVANQKGGTGKTTLADEITFLLEREGNNVTFISIDPQGGSVHQSSTGAEHGDKIDYQIIDTPGSLNKKFNEWCKNADLIFIPMQPSTRDLEPSIRTYEMASASAKKDTPVYFILNCFNPYGKMDRDLLEYLEAEDMFVATSVPRSVLFSQAAADGKSVFSMRYAKERGIINALDEIRNIIKKEL